MTLPSLKLDWKLVGNPRSAGSAEANGARRAGDERSCHLRDFFSLFYFFVVLKIAAGLLLNKTSAGLFILEFIDLDIESALGISLSASTVALCNLKGIKVLDSATLEAGKEH